LHRRWPILVGIRLPGSHCVTGEWQRRRLDIR
jgi:hypothetical protein